MQMSKQKNWEGESSIPHDEKGVELSPAYQHTPKFTSSTPMSSRSFFMEQKPGEHLKKPSGKYRPLSTAVFAESFRSAGQTTSDIANYGRGQTSIL